MSIDTWTVRAATPLELEWFCQEKVGYAPCVDIKGIVSVTARNYLGAVVAYDHWVPGSCEMHVWVGHAGAISRHFIREAINYPFANGRNVVIGRTPGWNYQALDFNNRIGFRETWRCAAGYGEVPPGTVHPQLLDSLHHYPLVFQELRPKDALKWFPQSVVDTLYPGVKWLQDLRYLRESSSTKTQQSNPPQTSGHSFNPWWRSRPGVIAPTTFTKEALEKAWKDMETLTKHVEIETEKRKLLLDALCGSAAETSLNTTDLPSISQKTSS